MSKDKTNSLILLAGLAIGGYLLYKTFFSGQQTQGGGYAYSWTPAVTPTIPPTVPPTPTIPTTPVAPVILPGGSVITQLPAPGIAPRSPGNTVLVAPNVPSGGITVIPSYSVYQPGTGTLAKPQVPQAPLNITNVFGFPVVPKLGTIVTQQVTPVPAIQKLLTPWGVSGGTVTTNVVKNAYNKPGGM